MREESNSLLRYNGHFVRNQNEQFHQRCSMEGAQARHASRSSHGMAIFTCEWRQFTPHLFAATHALEAEARKTKYPRSEEHTSELQSPDHLVCRLLLEKKNNRRY